MRLRRNKYGALATTVDGIRFDSQKEAARYIELRLLERAGEIRALVIQPRFPLRAQRNGELTSLAGVEVAVYVADFSYVNASDGVRHVEDVKGVRTPVYRLKKRHAEAQYGITIEEI